MCDEDDGSSRPYMVKCITYLDSAPTFSGPQGTGEPEVRVTFGFLGEVDEPVVLPLNDCKRLIVGTLRCLAEHDDSRAKMILDDFFPGLSVGCGNWIAETPSASQPPPTSPPTTVIKPQPELTCEFPLDPFASESVPMRVKTRYGKKVGRFYVVAGFLLGQSLILMCQSPIHPKRMTTLMYAIPNRILFRPESGVGDGFWQIYVRMPTGAKLQLGNDGWIKQSPKELRRIIGDRVYVLPQGICHPREKRNERPEDEF